MKSVSTHTLPNAAVQDEHILVVKRSTLFSLDGQPWQGLRTEGLDQYQALIHEHKEFLPRSLMEEDPTYKQIIPYLVFTYAGKVFLMQRRSDSTEQRLRNKHTLGIGGHIRQEDCTSGDIGEWARREFDEEVAYTGSYQIKALGMLNDDSTPVGSVHAGYVFLLIGDSSDIQVKSELKSGSLVTLEECQALHPHLESWSQIVLDQLKRLQLLA